MVRVTLNNLVLKTERVGNMMPAALADRIGSGFVAAIDHQTATLLSRGQFPLPRLPEPEQGSRQVVSDATSKPPAGKPVGATGSVSGAMARRNLRVSSTRTSAAGWRLVGAGRASYPGSYPCASRIGRDCQSPDRLNRRTDRNAAALRLRHRTVRPAPAAAK